MLSQIKIFVASSLLVTGLFSCNNSTKKEAPAEGFERTVETEALLVSLKEMPLHGILFGHHDDPLYGIGWSGEEGRSDVKSVCGDYPAVMSFDLGWVELGKEYSLDKVPFETIRKEIIDQYNRGGMSTISWHLDNPVTDGNSWDVSDSTVVASILPGGTHHEKFLTWIDALGDFMSSLQTADGVKVPILFRPWHEHTGSWFWWGQKHCTAEEYKALWQLTYDRLCEKGVNNLLYAYSPGSEPNSPEEYLERYPGDEIIDLIGFDCYQFDQSAAYKENMQKALGILSEVSKRLDKPMAVTETGYEAIPDPVWWTEVLMPLINDYPLAYVLVWRNAHDKENHYYAPYPGQISAADFVKFYEDPKTLFARDVAELLK